jgi:hypothetical protein
LVTTVAVLHQVDQEIEQLRFHVNSTLCAPQFAPFEIDLAVPPKRRVIRDPGAVKMASVGRRLQMD